MLQSDKGLSSVRLTETLGVNQPTAWRMGHAFRFMVVRENMPNGTVEIDHFHLGGRPRKHPDDLPPGILHRRSQFSSGECLETGLGAPENERMHVVRAFIGIHGFQID